MDDPNDNGTNWTACCRQGYRSIIAEPVYIEAGDFSWDSQKGFKPKAQPKAYLEQLRVLLQDELALRDGIGRIAVATIIESNVGLAVEAGLGAPWATEHYELLRVMVVLWVKKLLVDLIPTETITRIRYKDVAVEVHVGQVFIQGNYIVPDMALDWRPDWKSNGAIDWPSMRNISPLNAYLTWQHKDEVAPILTALNNMARELAKEASK